MSSTKRSTAKMTPRAPTSRGLTSPNSLQKIAIFIWRTFQMMNGSDPEVAGWCESGDMIYVCNQEAFAARLPEWGFKTNKIDSWVRQLNSYGFRKVNTSKLPASTGPAGLQSTSSSVSFAVPLSASDQATVATAGPAVVSATPVQRKQQQQASGRRKKKKKGGMDAEASAGGVSKKTKASGNRRALVPLSSVSSSSSAAAAGTPPPSPSAGWIFFKHENFRKDQPELLATINMSNNGGRGASEAAEAEIRLLRARIEELEQQAAESLAVRGMLVEMLLTEEQKETFERELPGMVRRFERQSLEAAAAASAGAGGGHEDDGREEEAGLARGAGAAIVAATPARGRAMNASPFSAVSVGSAGSSNLGGTALTSSMASSSMAGSNSNCSRPGSRPGSSVSDMDRRFGDCEIAEVTPFGEDEDAHQLRCFLQDDALLTDDEEHSRESFCQDGSGSHSLDASSSPRVFLPLFPQDPQEPQRLSLDDSDAAQFDEYDQHHSGDGGGDGGGDGARVVPAFDGQLRMSMFEQSGPSPVGKLSLFHSSSFEPVQVPPPSHPNDDEEENDDDDAAAANDDSNIENDEGGSDDCLPDFTELRGLSRMNSLTSENLSQHDAAWSVSSKE